MNPRRRFTRHLQTGLTALLLTALAAPGEVLSCTGCHEPQNTASPFHGTPLALGRDPSAITPWCGPARGFSSAHEVHPVLDAYCTVCHNGETFADGQANFNLTSRPAERIPSAFRLHYDASQAVFDVGFRLVCEP